MSAAVNGKQLRWVFSNGYDAYGMIGQEEAETDQVSKINTVTLERLRDQFSRPADYEAAIARHFNAQTLFIAHYDATSQKANFYRTQLVGVSPGKNISIYIKESEKLFRSFTRCHVLSEKAYAQKYDTVLPLLKQQQQRPRPQCCTIL